MKTWLKKEQENNVICYYLGLFHLPALLRIGIAAAFFAACFVTGN
jgi:hypothetical protein